MSTPELWSAVDEYVVDHLVPEAGGLEYVEQASHAAGLPPIAVTPAQGKLLQLLARMQQARAILELGTLGGYSTIWLARALPPDGRLITLEADPRCAEVARANIVRAGLQEMVELRLGPALETLPKLAAEGAGPFDLIFIDADKPNNPAYLEWALNLSRSGTVIVVDNVVRDGKIIDAASPDPDVKGTRRMFELMAREPRLNSTVLQTVGAKGYDGFALAVVR